MSSTSTGSPSGSGLSHGLAIEYKAFARRFFQDQAAAVPYLMATYYYPTSGFTIFFEEDSGKYKLMEHPPVGVFMNLVTYCAASWPTSGVSDQTGTLATHSRSSTRKANTESR